MSNKFEAFLDKFDEDSWFSTLQNLLSAIHPVDRTAVEIWFRFYPLELFRTLQTAQNKEELIQKFVLQGKYELKNQIDSSHWFLYGHRFWLETKAEIEKRAESFNDENSDLENEIRQIAKSISEKVKTDESLLIGITAVGLMTLAQSSLENFKNAAGEITKPSGLMKNSPDKILAERAKDDSQGLFGFLKTVDKQWTITYDETASDAKFKLFNDEEIASGSARDQSKNWRERDERCQEGVVPVECRSAACGTCWVGILSGAEKLTEVSPRERRQMKVFGYKQPEDAKPFLRLACQARVRGAISLVIPPWNGVFGKKVYGNVEEVELEPATTSAAKLRETISGATGGKK